MIRIVSAVVGLLAILVFAGNIRGESGATTHGVAVIAVASVESEYCEECEDMPNSHPEYEYIVNFRPPVPCPSPTTLTPNCAPVTIYIEAIQNVQADWLAALYYNCLYHSDDPELRSQLDDEAETVFANGVTEAQQNYVDDALQHCCH